VHLGRVDAEEANACALNVDGVAVDHAGVAGDLLSGCGRRHEERRAERQGRAEERDSTGTDGGERDQPAPANCTAALRREPVGSQQGLESGLEAAQSLLWMLRVARPWAAQAMQPVAALLIEVAGTAVDPQHAGRGFMRSFSEER
jgi:hypothetical protein